MIMMMIGNNNKVMMVKVDIKKIKIIFIISTLQSKRITRIKRITITITRIITINTTRITTNTNFTG